MAKKQNSKEKLYILGFGNVCISAGKTKSTSGLEFPFISVAEFKKEFLGEFKTGDDLSGKSIETSIDKVSRLVFTSKESIDVLARAVSNAYEILNELELKEIPTELNPETDENNEK